MSQTSNSGSSGFLSLLLVASIVLKLTNVITWSWWWVMAPFWGGIVLAVFVFAGIIIYHIIRK